MIPKGFKDCMKFTRGKPYACANATFTKYGKEISIHDYIQEGKDGTIAKDLVAKAGGMAQLAKQVEKIPESNMTIDMNMDIYMANRMLKTGKIAHEKIIREKALAEKLAELNKQTNTTTEVKTDAE